MTRREALLGMLGLAVTALPGCSGINGLAKTEAVDLNFAVMPSVFPRGKSKEIKKQYEAWCNKYHELHQETTVEFNILDYEEMLNDKGAFAYEIVLGEDSGTDAVLAQAFLVNTLVKENLISPIDTFLQTDGKIKKDDFFPGILDELKINDSLMAIPFTMNPVVIHYNCDIFKQADIKTPKIDWSWQEFMETAIRLRQFLTDDKFVLSFGPSDLLPLFFALGGSIYNDFYNPTTVTINDIASRSALKILNELFEQSLIPSVEQVKAYEPQKQESDNEVVGLSLSVSSSDNAGDNQVWQEMTDYILRMQQAVYNGDAAIWLGSLDESQTGFNIANFSDYSNSVENNQGIALLPFTSNSYLPAELTALFLPSASKKQKAAWLWLRFLLDQVPAINISPRLSQINSNNATSKLSIDKTAVIQAINQHKDNLTYLPISTLNRSIGILSDIWGLWSGKSLDDILIAAENKLKSILDEKDKPSN